MTRALDVAAIVGVAITIWIIYLYRKKRLTEDHAILWIFISLSIIIMSTTQDLLWILKWTLGVWNVTEVVLAAFIGFLLIMSIYYSVKISELTDQNERLVQELALIEAAVFPLREDEKKKTS